MNAGVVAFLAVVRKEFRQIAVDRRMIGVLLVAPLLQVLIFGVAVDLDVDDVPTVFVDLDHTPESRIHVEGLLADGTLADAGRLPDGDAALDAMDAGVSAAVVVPQGFSDALLRGDPARVQVMVDGTDPNRSNVLVATANGYFAREGMALMAKRAAMAGRLPAGTIEVRPRVLANPSLETSAFMVPAVSGMLLIMVTALVTAMGLARERESGTLEQVLVTPIPSWALLAGKVIPYVLIGIFDMILAMGVGGTVFQVPLNGPLPLIFVATLLYLMSTVGVGLLASTAADTQQQAFILGFMFMIPAILLSGAMTPVRAMPELLQWATFLNPLRWYVEILRADLLRGAGFLDLWRPLLALLLIGSALSLTAVSRFRKQLG